VNNVDVGLSIANNLRNVFGIVLALSLGEAYKQVIADTANNPGEKSIRRDSLPSMASFLLLLIPFFQGMARFLDTAYPQAVRPTSYGPWLLFDICAFTTEASLFFVMSRTLRFEQWRRFYGAVLGILVTDTFWGAVTLNWRHIETVRPWMLSNLVCLILLGAIFIRFGERPKLGPWIACALMLGRTVADYWTSWTFYFPK
jgi:hypothetical protein